jgi:integrase
VINMPRVAKTLTDRECANLKSIGSHPVGGEPGLYLEISENGLKRWFFRATTGKTPDGKQIRKEIPVGAYPAITLKEARNQARALRLKIQDGIDPALEKKRAKSKLALEKNNLVTVTDCADQFVKFKAPSWKSRKTELLFRNKLKTYAFPHIGDAFVGDVETHHITSILEPLWQTMPDTAKKLRNHLSNVFNFAIAKGWRESYNPVGPQLTATLGKQPDGHHFPALQANDLHRFLSHLRTKSTISAKAIEFLLLTASRSGDVRGAKWHEFDLPNMTWTIPTHRTKTKKKPHRIPLSTSAIQLLNCVPKISDTQFVFMGAAGGAMSDMTLSKYMKELDAEDIRNGNTGYRDPNELNRGGEPKIAVPHGLRSTFRDWSAEYTSYPNEIIELAMQHDISNKVEAAYRRGDQLNKRRPLMEDWANFCESPFLAPSIEDDDEPD